MAYLLFLIRPCKTCGRSATHIVTDLANRPVAIYCSRHAGAGLAEQDAREKLALKGVRPQG